LYNKYYFLLIFIFFQPDGRKLLKNRKRLNVDTVNVDQVNVDPVSGSHVDKVADVERESTVISQLMNPKSSVSKNIYIYFYIVISALGCILRIVI